LEVGRKASRKIDRRRKSKIGWKAELEGRQSTQVERPTGRESGKVDPRRKSKIGRKAEPEGWQTTQVGG